MNAAKLKPRPPMRPLQLNIKITTDMMAWLEAYAATVGTSKSDLVYQLLDACREDQAYNLERKSET